MMGPAAVRRRCPPSRRQRAVEVLHTRSTSGLVAPEWTRGSDHDTTTPRRGTRGRAPYAHQALSPRPATEGRCVGTSLGAARTSSGPPPDCRTCDRPAPGSVGTRSYGLACHHISSLNRAPMTRCWTLPEPTETRSDNSRSALSVVPPDPWSAWLGSYSAATAQAYRRDAGEW